MRKYLVDPVGNLMGQQRWNSYATQGGLVDDRIGAAKIDFDDDPRANIKSIDRDV